MTGVPPETPHGGSIAGTGIPPVELPGRAAVAGRLVYDEIITLVTGKHDIVDGGDVTIHIADIGSALTGMTKMNHFGIVCCGKYPGSVFDII